jgi:hypothetical protein
VVSVTKAETKVAHSTRKVGVKENVDTWSWSTLVPCLVAGALRGAFACCSKQRGKARFVTAAALSTALQYSAGGRAHRMEANNASHALCHFRCCHWLHDWRERPATIVAQSLALRVGTQNAQSKSLSLR